MDLSNMNVFDLLSNEKDNEGEEDAKLLKRTKEWLNEAGFPQYVQMYNDGAKCISLSSVTDDHPEFGGEALLALFKRIEILNRSLAPKKELNTLTRPIKHSKTINKSPNFQILDEDNDDEISTDSGNDVDKTKSNTDDSEDTSPEPVADIEKLMTKPNDDDDSSEDEDEDDKENIMGHTALSRKWFYEPHTRRWSHVEPSNNLVGGDQKFYANNNTNNNNDDKKNNNNKTLQSYLGSLLPKPYHRQQQNQQNRASKSSNRVISQSQTDQNSTNVNNKSAGFSLIRSVSRFNPNQFSFRMNSNSSNNKGKNKVPPEVSEHEEQSSNMDKNSITTSQPLFLNNSQISPIGDQIQRPASINVTNNETSAKLLDPVINLLESDLKSLDLYTVKTNRKLSPDKSTCIPASSSSTAVRPQSLYLSPQSQQSLDPSSTKSTPSSTIHKNNKTRDNSTLPYSPNSIPSFHPVTDSEDNEYNDNRTIGRDNFLSQSFSVRKSVAIDSKRFNRFEPSRWSHNIARNFTDQSILDVTGGVTEYQTISDNLFNLTCMTVNDMNCLNQKSLLDCTAQIEKYLPEDTSNHKSIFSWKLPKIRTSNRKKKSANNLPAFPDGHSSNATSTSSSPLSTNSVPCYPPVFGVNLASHQTRFGKPYPPTLELIFEYLYKHIPTSHGVFRKTGMKSRIDTFKHQIDVNPYLSNFEGYTLHDIADTLKCFFRELPIRLFDLKISTTLVTLYDCVPKLERLDKLKWTLYTLPDENRIALRKLLHFLSYISQFSGETMMDTRNLSLCFGPSLFTFQSEQAFYSSGSSNSAYPNLNSHASFRIKKNANNNLGAGPNAKHLSEQNASQLCMIDLITHHEQLFTVTESLILDIKSKPLSNWEPISLEQMFEPIIWQSWIQEKIRNLYQEAVGSLASSNHNSKVSNNLTTSPPVLNNGNQSSKNTLNLSFRHDTSSAHVSPTSSGYAKNSFSTNNNITPSWSSIHKETMKRTIAHIRWQLPKYFRNSKIDENVSDVDYFDYQKHLSYSSSLDNMIPNGLSLNFRKVDNHGDNIVLRTWKATIEIEAKPGLVYNAIKNHRELWDSFIEDVSVLDEINEYSELVRMRLANPDQHNSQRIAYMLRSHQLGVAGSGNLLVSESVSSVVNHGSSSEEEVSSTVFRDDFFIEASHDFGCRVTWVCRIDLGGFHANWYASYWGAKMLGSLCALRRCMLWGGDLEKQGDHYRTMIAKQQQAPQNESLMSGNISESTEKNLVMDISQEDFQMARETDL